MSLQNETMETVDSILDMVQGIIRAFTSAVIQYPLIGATIMGMFFWNSRKKLKLK